MRRKICVVTGSRADYGLLRWVLEGIRNAPHLDLQIIATGMHLAPEFGLTYREIEADGFRIDRKVEMLLSSDTPEGIAKSMGLGLIGCAEALAHLQPHLALVLGDRFEILSAVSAALVAGIPLAHLHGGEVTEGAFDESIRHAITKMAQLHFVAAEPYRRRVIQLGELPERVFTVGGLGLDNIKKLSLLDRRQLETALDLHFDRRSLLVTFHPATTEQTPATEQLGELLAALEALSDTTLVFTMPNADPGGRALSEMVREFVAAHANARVYTSLGQVRYLSCLRHVDGVVGNSSSGLIEAPAFHIGTINIGDRQTGRLKAASVIDSPADRTAIVGALARLYSREFQEALPSVINPYGEAGASERVVDVLAHHPLESLERKPFYDMVASDDFRR